MNLSLFGCCKHAKHCNYFVIIFACCHNVKQAVIRRHHLQVCDHDQCDDCYCSEGEAQISNQLRRNNLKNKKKLGQTPATWTVKNWSNYIWSTFFSEGEKYSNKQHFKGILSADLRCGKRSLHQLCHIFKTKYSRVGYKWWDGFLLVKYISASEHVSTQLKIDSQVKNACKVCEC